MKYQLEDFEYLKPFLNNAEEIFNEMKKAAEENETVKCFLKNDATSTEFLSHTKYWLEDNGLRKDEEDYSDLKVGNWFSLPIYKKNFPLRYGDIEALFPYLTSLLRNVKGIEFASFFSLDANSIVPEHAHNRKHLVFHLCVSETKGESYMICNGEKFICEKPNDTALFDYSYPHSSVNNGSQPRINLVVDFNPFD